MRRIDLFCKLVAPVVVSFMDGLLSTKIAIWVVLGINVAVVLVEYFAIAQVCHLTLDARIVLTRAGILFSS